jgi:phage shock protein A
LLLNCRLADQEDLIRRRANELMALETHASRLQQQNGSLNETVFRLAAQQHDIGSKIDTLSSTKTSS